MRRFLFSLLLPTCLKAATLMLYNDSSYILEAQVTSAEGKAIGAMTVTPKSQVSWVDPYGGTIDGIVSSPYTVKWICQSGTIYGISYKVAAGTTTNALGSNGPRRCQQEDSSYNP